MEIVWAVRTRECVKVRTMREGMFQGAGGARDEVARVRGAKRGQRASSADTVRERRMGRTRAGRGQHANKGRRGGCAGRAGRGLYPPQGTGGAQGEGG